MMTLWRLPWLPVVGVAFALLACGNSSNEVGDDGGAVSCPQVLPCRDDNGAPNYSVPSYKTEIRPILQVACVTCHNDDGGIGGKSEASYMEVSNQVTSMADQVTDCMMPPPTGPQLSTAQRIALEEWLSCGGPNN
jgi:hypothetical protein